MKKHTKRYRETDEKFLQGAYLVASGKQSVFGVTVVGICKRVNIHVSTFYRHFKSLFGFSHYFDQRFLEDFSDYLKALSKSSLASEKVYEKIFIFIYRHRKVIRLKLAFHDNYLLEEVFRMSRPLITQKWSNYGAESNSFIYGNFSACAIHCVTTWCWNHKFSSNQISPLSKQLAKLSTLAGPTLAPVSKIC